MPTPVSDPTRLVATLVAAPGSRALDEGLVAQVLASLPAGVAAQPTPPAWLKPGEAIDIFLASRNGDIASWESLRRLGRSLLDPLGPRPIDVIVQPAEGRRKRLFLADMDSTMIEQECIDELADLVGLKREVSAITERAMRGELEFEPALRERVALLKGLSAGVVDRLLEERITLMPGGPVLLATLRAHGTQTCLVSGGFTLFTEAIAARLGFHEHRANRLIVENGRLAGTVAEPILGRQAKLDTLVDLRNRYGVDATQTLAVGDGANDLAMLSAAGLGVAYRAKPAVAQAAHAAITHGDLTALLFAQGYRAAEFAAVS